MLFLSVLLISLIHYILSSIFSLCNPDNVFNLISSIACAWISDNPNLSINLSFASSYEPSLIILITSSILSNAILILLIYVLLLLLCLIQILFFLRLLLFYVLYMWSKHCLNVKILGSPFTNATNIIIPNVSCICVNLYNWI